MTRRSSDGRTGCPGAGCRPTEVYCEQGEPDHGVCPRCGGLYTLRLDGQIRAHRVQADKVVPALWEPLWLRRRRGGTIQQRRA